MDANSSRSSSRRRRKVVVIGAGASGLGTARWLLDYYGSGRGEGADVALVEEEDVPEVVVLEARDRYGGRVNTIPFGGCLVDLGASWLHEHDPSANPSNPLSIMAKRLNLSLKNTNFDNGIAFDTKGQRIKDKLVEKAWHDCEQAFCSACKPHTSGLREYDGDVDLETLIKSKVSIDIWDNPSFQSWLSDYDFEFGVSLNKLSPYAVNARWVNSIEDDEEEDLNMVFMDTGFKGILDGLISGEATDNESMRRQQLLLRSKVMSGSKTRSSPPLSSSASSSEVTHSLFSKSLLRPKINVLLGHKVFRVTDHSQSPPLPSSSLSSSSSSSSSTAAISPRVTVHVEVAQGGHGVSTPPEILEIDADAVVVCLPIGVLKSTNESESKVEFVPPLSAKKRLAIEKAGFGNVVKIVMEFDRVFWPSSSEFLIIADKDLCTPYDVEEKEVDEAKTDSSGGGGGSRSTTAPYQKRGLLTSFWNLFHVNKKKILIGYGLGDGADMIDKMSNEELEALLLSRLAALATNCPAGYKPKPIRWMRTSWKDDPFTLGAYSYVPKGVNCLDIFEELGRKESSCVYFAGEATQADTNLRASVNGAFQSGIRAAEEVIEHLHKINDDR